MPNEDLVADNGYELEDGEKGGREDGAQVESDANLVGWKVGVPVALARGGLADGSTVTENTPDRKELETGENEAK